MILLTGFGPFMEYKYNPSAEVARRLSEETGYPHVILEVSYKKAFEALLEAFRRYRPKAIVSFGLAPRPIITIEKFALNRIDGKDNDGENPKGYIAELEPGAYSTEQDVDSLVEAIRSAGIPASVSYHAGTYLCNYVYFHALRLSRRSLFVHIPPDYKLALMLKRPIATMSIEDEIKAGRIVLEKIKTRRVFVPSLLKRVSVRTRSLRAPYSTRLERRLLPL